jgi:CheY-like chemotaxis protein
MRPTDPCREKSSASSAAWPKGPPEFHEISKSAGLRMSVQTNRPASVLLADDDPAQVRLWRHVLRSGLAEDTPIEVMTDPLAAVTYVQNHMVDILVTDLSMPGIGGLDLLCCLKARNQCAQGVLITGTSTIESLLASIDLGSVDYLLKPFQPEVLVELVRQADARLQRWRVALAGTFRRVHTQLAPASGSPATAAGSELSVATQQPLGIVLSNSTYKVLHADDDPVTPQLLK